ncbi:MAG: FAD-binding protein [Acidobacteriota bacterium]
MTFLWATKAERIIAEGGAVRGLLVRDLRRNRARILKGRSVLIATGGFGSNLELVRKHWPKDLPSPGRLLAGASPFATESGHEMVVAVGGVLTRMDHQWSYVLGLPDPRDSTGDRGLASFNFQAIWVNQLGKRFVQEFGDPKVLLKTLLSQPGGSYWTVFDSEGSPSPGTTVSEKSAG